MLIVFYLSIFYSPYSIVVRAGQVLYYIKIIMVMTSCKICHLKLLRVPKPFYPDLLSEKSGNSSTLSDLTTDGNPSLGSGRFVVQRPKSRSRSRHEEALNYNIRPTSILTDYSR